MTCSPSWHSRSYAVGAMFLIVCLAAAPGCIAPGAAAPGNAIQTSRAAQPVGPTQSDRLLAYYADLREGPFAVIADFENPAHMEIVNLGGGDASRATLHRTRGRKETGKACLEFVAAAVEDQVTLGGQSAADWHLRRNWREFDLFLMSVWSPAAGVPLALSVSAGLDDQEETVETRQTLAKGWNLLRFDLAELGERLPLEEVRAVRLNVSELRKPVTLYIDDLLLAANRSDVFGDSSNTKGELYLRKSGRRWHVGVGGRFELTFAHGQVVGWHDLSRDPYRLRNLVRGAALGPTVVTLDAETGQVSADADPTAQYETVTRVKEINALRAVVYCAWQTRRPGDRVVAHSATYTVYASGHIFVEVSRTPAVPAAEGTAALAVTVAADDARAIRTVGPSQDEPTAWFALLEPAEGGSTMLFTAVDVQDAALALSTAQESDEERLLLIAQPDAEATPATTWYAQLYCPARALDEADARKWAREFAAPQAPDPDVGTVAAESDHEGFDRANGCFRLQPDSGQIRWRVTGDRAAHSAGAYCVDSAAKSPAWVYVNHLIHPTVIRDASGSLLFQVDARADALIEVYWQQPSATQSSPTKK